MKPAPLPIKDFTYELPEGRIAAHPMPARDTSKLLRFQSGRISDHKFSQLPDLLTNNHTLFFNDTKVIPARFAFKKVSGASIEVFILHPVLPSKWLSSAMAATEKCTWVCTIGNLKRWPDELTLTMDIGNLHLEARLADRNAGMVEFTWTPASATFAEVVQSAGAVPLPPYIKRPADEADKERYQTVYSRLEGAVAAPTAGLHFTQSIINQLAEKGISRYFLTLHVSAGTFLPVKSENAMDHPMHEEQVVISKASIEGLLLDGKSVVAVGTTAMRTLESVYWFGARLLQSGNATFDIRSFEPYEQETPLPSRQEALTAVLDYMISNTLPQITGQTSIYIFPGYSFKVCSGLITNFHQPGSTLLLLVAAFAGQAWKDIYNHALANDYRFLSYGDSSLLLPG